MMAIVMVFTATTIYAYGSNEEGINGKINPCPHTMTTTEITGETEVHVECTIHTNCYIARHITTTKVTCQECGYYYYTTRTTETHNMLSK